MTKDDVLAAIDDVCGRYGERTTGNAVERAAIEALAILVVEDRGAVVAALRQLLSHRVRPEERGPEDALPEGRLWLAAHAAAQLAVKELEPDMEQLIADVKLGHTLRPVHEEMLTRHLRELQGLTNDEDPTT